MPHRRLAKHSDKGTLGSGVGVHDLTQVLQLALVQPKARQPDRVFDAHQRFVNV